MSFKKKRAKKEIVNLKPNSNLEGRSSIHGFNHSRFYMHMVTL